MKKQASIILATLGAAVLPAAAQGSLTPPPGVPGPVMKTLDQIEGRSPVNTLPGDGTAAHIITLPGSYYFTGPISGQGGKAGIRIEASNVTIDLNGFTLEAVGGSTKGIEVLSAGGPVVIRNGQLRFWPQHAIYFQSPSQFVLEDLVITSVQQYGIYAQGAGSIERVAVIGAKEIGIYCAGTSSQAPIIRSCRVENITNTGAASGITAPYGLVTQSTVANVTGSSTTYGINAQNGRVESSVVRKVTSSASGVTGIDASDVTDCTAQEIRTQGNQHNAYGIDGNENVRNCSVVDVVGTFFSTGIYSNCVSNCRVKTIGSANGINYGISAAMVLDSSIEDVNLGDGRGIVLQNNGQASRNSVKNCLYGIFTDNTALVDQNTITAIIGIQVAVTGVHAAVSDNTLNSITPGQGTGISAGSNSGVRIERNHVSGFNTGIQSTSNTALVVRNSARANTTNFSIHASMPVVTPATLGTNPNANISQ